MIKNKLNNYIMIGGLATVLTIGSYTVVNSILENNELAKYTNTIVIEDKETLTKESVVTEIKNLCKLEVMSIDVTKEIKLKEGDFFTKEQNVKFNLTSTFILDLNNITTESVIINDMGEIVIFSKIPSINVSFNEGNTEFGDIEKSFLTFGNLDTSIEELESIKSELKKSVEIEMVKYMELAKEQSEQSIKDALLKLSKDNKEVGVRWL